MIRIYSPDKARAIDYNKQLQMSKFKKASECRENRCFEKYIFVEVKVSHLKQKDTKSSAEWRLWTVTGQLSSIAPYSR